MIFTMPKAIIAINLYGMTYTINTIFNIANSYLISIIETSTLFIRRNNFLQREIDFKNNLTPSININNSTSLDLKYLENDIQIIKINHNND